MDETVKAINQAGGEAMACWADVRNLTAMEDVVKDAKQRFGPINGVCANAGICTYVRNTWEMTAEEWRDTIDINLTGAWHTVRAVVPSMIEAGPGGFITFIGSTAAMTGFPFLGHYVASKHGLVGLMRTLAIELAAMSIRVNIVQPTGVATVMYDDPSKQEMIDHAPEMATWFRNVLPVARVVSLVT